MKKQTAKQMLTTAEVLLKVAIGFLVLSLATTLFVTINQVNVIKSLRYVEGQVSLHNEDIARLTARVEALEDGESKTKTSLKKLNRKITRTKRFVTNGFNKVSDAISKIEYSIKLICCGTKEQETTQ